MTQHIFEEAALDIEYWKADIKRASNFKEIAFIFSQCFGLKADDIPGQESPAAPDEYKNDGSDFGLKVKGIKAREKLNAQAKEIIERVTDPKQLTQGEVEILKQYSGRGGLTENSQFECYTPTHVAEGLWDALLENGLENGNLLDPCVGSGVFSATKPKGTLMTGADIDPVGSKVAQLLNPEDSIQNKSFEKLVSETPDDTFDGVVGNVPFGDVRGANIYEDSSYQDEKRIERYFILRALDKIKPGKLACFVVPVNIVGAKGGKWETWRIAVSKKAEFLGAHKLPSKTFSAQGTDTVVDVIVLKKHPKDLLNKMDSLRIETLREANVVWDEFINGMYWKGEGRKFIMGKYMPKIEGDRWSREVVDSDVDNEGLKRKLALRFNSRINWDALEVAEPVIKNYVEGDRRIINGESYELQNGDWIKTAQAEIAPTVIDKAKYGAGTYDDLKALFATPKASLTLTAKQAFAAFKTWPDLLSTLQSDAVKFAMSQEPKYQEQVYRGTVIGGMLGRLQVKENEGTAGTEEIFELQEIVTREIDKYGHPKNNKGINLLGESSRAFGLFLNAVDEKGNFSDLLSGNLQDTGKSLQYDSKSIQSVVEHLFIREGITSIELDDVKQLYSGSRALESLADVAEDDNVAITPDGLIMPISRFAAGDIYPKMQSLRDAMASEPDERIKAKYQKQIEAIVKKRKTTSAENITFGLRQKWFSRKYVVDFLKETGYNQISYGSFKKVDEENPITGEIETEERFVDDYNDPFGEFRGYGNAAGFLKQLNRYLNGKNVTSSKQEYKEEYERMVRDIEDRFNVWMQQHPDLDMNVERYNQKFNGFLPFEYDGNIELKDVSPQVKLHDFQAAGVKRLSEEGRGCLAYDVGLGKTFTALGLYAYNRQLGRSKKTCIVVPNAVLANWYHESKMFLGNHNNVLTVGFKPKLDKKGNIQREPILDEEGKPKKNKHTGEIEYQDALIRNDSKEDVFEDMWKIPTSNVSLVIMTKEKFGMIPMKPSTKRGYADKMVERALISEKVADSAVNENSQGAGQKKVSYADAKHTDSLAQTYANEGTKKKGELPYFEDMGFTEVIVDEAHEFKNSYQAGENTKNIAYLPTAPSAKRALDMSMKMNFLRDSNNGRGAYLLTATPVTNSPFEIFNMLSLICPVEEFERFGVYTVDDFVRVFGDIQQVDKVKVSGEIANVQGLVGFQNLDGLRNLFHKYVNMKSVKDFDPPPFELPPHDEIHDEVAMTEEQQTVYDVLRERAKEAAKPGGGKRGKDTMFGVIRDMDRVTTDMDLYLHNMTFHFAIKDKAKVDNLITKIPKTIKVTGTDEDGLSFKYDMPFKYEAKQDGDTYVLVVPEDFEDLVVSRFAEAVIDETDVGHPVTPKYAKLIERLREHYEAKGKQLIFTEEKSQHQKIRRLIVNQVPVWADKIGVINAETANGDKLQKIAGAYNGNQLKIIVANKKAEVGVNLQKGTTAIHHLTLPWTPASIQQRNGRGVRQGNTAAHIDVYYYLGKGSFDAYRLDLLQKKSGWMNELFNGEQSTAENANAFNADEFVDMLESDPEEAKKRRLERLAKKEAERREREDKISLNNLAQLQNATIALANIDSDKEGERERLTEKIPETEKKIARYEARLKEAKDKDEIERIEAALGINKRSLASSKKALETLDTRFADKKEKLGTKIKQTTGYLKAIGQKGRLPFDKAVLDNPNTSVVTPSGECISVNDTLEVKAEEWDGADTGTILKITEIDVADKLFKCESVTGYLSYAAFKNVNKKKSDGNYDFGWHPIAEWPSAGTMVKVSYSEKELALKKVLNSQITYYADILKLGLDKDTFYDNLDKLQLSSSSLMIFRDEEGFKISRLAAMEGDKSSLVFPEPTDENFRRKLCEAYLKSDRNYYDNHLMQGLLGENFQEIAMKYGKSLSESEVTEIAAGVWKALQAKVLENGENETSARRLLNLCMDYRYNLIADARAEAGKRGDNQEDINGWISKYISSLEDDLQNKLISQQAEEKKKEMEALKDHPDYTEVPEKVSGAFAELGITVKTNMTRMTIPGFKRRRGDEIEPFKRWYFQDKNGKNGAIFKAKEMLKARFGAKFFSDAGGEFNGAWWHVPITADLAEIYELIS